MRHATRPVNHPLCLTTIALISAIALKLSAFTLMSHAAASSSKFQLIINNALDTYRKRTKKDLLTHPLATRLQACDTPAAILTILREQIHGLDQSQSGAERWSRWLDPTVNVLFAFSGTIGAGVGLVRLRTCTHPRSAFSYSFGRYLLPRVWFLLESASSFQSVPPSIFARGPIVTSNVLRQRRTFGQVRTPFWTSLSE